MTAADLRPELRRLIGLMQRAEGNSDGWPVESIAISNWWAFTALARVHGVIPWLLHRLDASGLALPDSELSVWNHHKRINGARAMLAWAVNVRLVSEFARAGISAMPLKGVSGALRHYGNPSIRQVGDIDILVPIDRMDEASAVLQRIGFVQAFPARAINDAEHAWLMNRTHHFKFAHAASGQPIDLHWAFHDNLMLDRSDRRWIEQPHGSVEYQGECLPALDSVTEYLLLLTHLIRSGWRRLLWILDAHRAWSDLSDEHRRQARKALARMNLGNAQQRFERLAGTLICGVPLPTNRLPSEIHLVVRCNEERSVGFLGLHLIDLILVRPDLAYRWDTLKFLALTWTDIDMLRLPSSLFWLYVPLRIPLLIYRRGVRPLFHGWARLFGRARLSFLTPSHLRRKPK